MWFCFGEQMLKRALILVLLFLITPNASAVGQELKKISLGYPSLAFTQSHIWVAKEEGLFKKYGLDVDPVFLRGGQVATQALAAGEPPIVNVGTVIQANLSGYNLVLVATIETRYYFLLFVRPDISRLEQLKGKKLGVSGFGSNTHYAALILLKHLNLEPNKDVALIPGVRMQNGSGRWPPEKSMQRFLTYPPRPLQKRWASLTFSRSRTWGSKFKVTASPPRAPISRAAETR
jgi:ABC-type nitrate/sulfonate/bicarbonate transport system substrate-binding protein